MSSTVLEEKDGTIFFHKSLSFKLHLAIFLSLDGYRHASSAQVDIEYMVHDSKCPLAPRSLESGVVGRDIYVIRVAELNHKVLDHLCELQVYARTVQGSGQVSLEPEHGGILQQDGYKLDQNLQKERLGLEA